MAHGENSKVHTQVELEPLRYRHVIPLQRLVMKNAVDLKPDFPGLVDRYSTLISAFRSVRRAIKSPTTHAYAVKVGGDNLTREDYLIPPYLRVAGLVTMQQDPENDSVAMMAGWVDRDARGSSVGWRAARILETFAELRGVNLLEAYVRPENTAATKTVTTAGYQAVGEVAPYAEVGEAEPKPRQKFIRPIAYHY